MVLPRSCPLIVMCLLSAFISCSSVSSEQVEPFRLKQIVVFGDSLSDTGNTLLLTRYLEGIGEKPWFYDDLFSRAWTYLPIPTFMGGPMPPEGYYSGRFSNGPLGSEMTASMLGLYTSDPEQYVNLAFAGSWSVPASRYIRSWLDLWHNPQVNLQEWLGHLLSGRSKWLLPSTHEIALWYLDKYARLDPDSLYILASGANDYQNGFWDVGAIVGVQEEIIEKLIKAGARHIGWGTLPDLTFTPCFQGSTETSRILRTLELHNQAILRLKERFKSEFPEVKITFIDCYAAMKLFYQHAGSFGFTVTDRGCTDISIPGCANPAGRLIVDVASTGFQVCDNPDEHFFWDAMHPTTRAYEHMATYLCIMAGLSGYWTDCRLPENFDTESAMNLLDLVVEGGGLEGVIPEREKVEKLLKLRD